MKDSCQVRFDEFSVCSTKPAREKSMADKIEVCMCEKCGNEAEMTVSCQWIEVRSPSGETQKKQRETRTCKVCGNEADLVVDFD
jgi:hypothetical protein